MTTTRKTLVIAPQWAGTKKSDFYPWLVDKLGALDDGPACRIVPSPTRPPTPSAYGEALDAALAALSAKRLAHTVLLGHSVGSHALLQSLARLPEDRTVGALVIVAGWWDINRDTWDGFGLPWSDIQTWLDVALDDATVRHRVGAIRVLLSEGDRIPASSAADTGAAYASRLGAEIHLLEGRGHFNATEQPEVLSAVTAALGEL